MTQRKPKRFRYYQDMRKASPKQYHSPENRKQMEQDRQALGVESFYSTDDAAANGLSEEITQAIMRHLQEKS